MVNNVIFSQIVTVHDRCMTHHLTDFENFRKIFAAEKCSFQVLLQFIFWTVFPMSRFNFNLWCLKTVICRNPSKIFPYLEQTEFKKASFCESVQCYLGPFCNMVTWPYRVTVNFKVSFIFRISKKLNILFLRMKWNKTEYNGIRRKSRSLKLTFPSRFSMTYDSIVITMSDFSQNIIWYLKIFENLGEKISMKFVSISSAGYNSKSFQQELTRFWW